MGFILGFYSFISLFGFVANSLNFFFGKYPEWKFNSLVHLGSSFLFTYFYYRLSKSSGLVNVVNGETVTDPIFGIFFVMLNLFLPLVVLGFIFREFPIGKEK